MHTEHATTEAGTEVRSDRAKLSVEGERVRLFDPHHWRQAVRLYLSWLWTNRFSSQEVLDLSFPTFTPDYARDGRGMVHLRYHAVTDKFSAFGVYDQGIPPSLYYDVREQSVLRVRVETSAVLRDALAQFAWNHQIKVMEIDLSPHFHRSGMEKLWLWTTRGAIRVYKEPRNL